jgi:hypothetical protein
MSKQTLKIRWPAQNTDLKLIEENPSPTSLSKERVEYLEEKVKTLASLLKGRNVLLGGGISIAKILSCYPENFRKQILPSELREIRGFYRDHSSLKLLCPEEELEPLADNLKKRNYLLFALNPARHKESIEDRLEEAIEIDPSQCFSCKRLYFIKKDYLEEKNSSKEKFFAFKYDEIEKVIRVLLHSYQTKEGEQLARKERYVFINPENQKKVPYEKIEVVCEETETKCPFVEFEGCYLTLSPNVYIRLAHPTYLLLAKTKAYRNSPGDKRHELDISVLERIISMIEPNKNLNEILYPKST